MMFERSAPIEFRAEGRRLVGPAMVYGDTSPSHRERFEAGAFGNIRDGNTRTLNLRHQPLQAIAWTGSGGLELKDTREQLTVVVNVPDTPAGNTALRDVAAGELNGFSVEFNAKSERRDAGIRVVESAVLAGIGLVKAPSYQKSKAEIRQRSGMTLGAVIPSDTDLECECSGASCKFARFNQQLMNDMWSEVWERFEREVVAVNGDYKSPLGSVARVRFAA